MHFYDAHNHLQDSRLAPFCESVVTAAQRAGVRKMVVNGTSENDWPQVASLAENFPDLVIPAFGLHPWHVGKQSAKWTTVMRDFLLRFPASPVGEIGLDHRVTAHDSAAQAEVMTAQLAMARELKRPVVIHCVKAFGALEKMLRETSPLPRGFLLHGYGGSLEQMKIFASLGGWFSCSGDIFHANKATRRAVFAAVSLDRLLVETDAPDMLGPESCQRENFPEGDGTVTRLNHPANLPAIYAALAELRKMSVEDFATQVEKNFTQFFG